MGQDVFMQRLGPDRDEPYDRDLVLGILTRGAIDSASRCFISYPDGGGGGEVFGIEKEPFTSFMFAHFGGPEFAARIYELADRTCSLLLWTSGPDGDYLGVTQPDYLPLAQAVIPDEEIAVFRDLDHMASLMGRWILTPKRYITCA